MSDIDNWINEDTSQRTLAPAAVGSQVLLMAAISVATIIAFNLLRPRNKIVYEPKVKYHDGDKVPPRIADGIFGWVSPLIHTKEPELVEKIGLDAAIFLRFLRMCRFLFTCIAVLACVMLMPVDITYNLKHVPSQSRDILSILTIRDVSGNFLFIHVAVTYLISFLVMGFVWMNWKEVVRLRHEWFRSPEYTKSFYARTLMVTDVQKQLQSDEGLRAIFETIQVPYPTTSVHIGRKVGQLPELIDFHNDTVRELEQVLVKYLKDGKVGKQRPMIRLGGFLCFGGEKKDAIDYYTAKLRRSETAVENYRSQIDLRKPESYGFASMAAVPYAHIVANMLRGKHPKKATILLAPNPKDMVWENLSRSKAELAQRKTTGWTILIAVCFFNTIPLLIISILANLASLTAYVSFLEKWSVASPGTFTFVSGVLPPSVSALFGYALPHIMRVLSKYQGAYTHSRLDRAVVARYFAFLVISQLIVFTLIGVIFKSVQQIVHQIGDHDSFKTIIQNLDKLPRTINETYIDQASYWLTYFPLRGFLVVFDLAQIINLVVIFIKTHLFGRTPREHREWTQPPNFQYPIYYSNLLFMGTVALFFAPLSPLVAVAAAVVFWVSSWVYKYQLMFVFVSRVETGGRMWNVVINRLLFSAALMQALMVLTIGLQYGFKSLFWLTTIPPIIFVFIFKIYLNRKFQAAFQYYIPSDEELRLAHVHSKRSDNVGNKLEKRFGHPALHAELFTPMVHAHMTHLLSEVFTGKIANVQTKLDDFGGSKIDARVVAGGVTIAGIEQRDLEYDPTLYRRDRGELDWDERSVASGNILGSDTASMKHPVAPYYAGSRPSSPAPSKIAGYDRYLTQGTQQEFEMSRLDVDQLPLLSSQTPAYYNQNVMMGSPSMTSLPSYADASPPMNPNPQAMPPMPRMPTAYDSQYNLTEGYREAPLHRPYPSPEWR
ncbi:DUF221-domain-containing protein [Amylocystis lapponica]|nr:DUF221-domain-containing protein [Amylocystis lapponica]